MSDVVHLRQSYSERIAAALDRLLAGECGPAERRELTSTIVKSVNEEKRLLGRLDRLSGRLPISDQLRADMAIAAQQQQEHLQALSAVLSYWDSECVRAGDSKPDALADSVIAVLARMPSPALARLVAEAGVGPDADASVSEGPVAWPRLRRLSKALKAHSWDGVDAESRRACLLAFGEIAQADLLRLAKQATSDRELVPFLSAMRDYASWQFPSPDGAPRDELLREIVSMAGRYGPSESFEILDLARRLSADDAAHGALREITDDLEKARAITARLPGADSPAQSTRS